LSQPLQLLQKRATVGHAQVLHASLEAASDREKEISASITVMVHALAVANIMLSCISHSLTSHGCFQ